MNRIYYSIIALLSLTLLAAHPKPTSIEVKVPKWAQKSYLMMGWSYGVPMGNTYKNNPKSSNTGAQIGYHLRISKKLSVGPMLHWQLFDSNFVSKSAKAATSSIGHKELRIFSLLCSMQYYFLKRETMLTYIGGGLGANRVNRLALFENDTSSPHWQPGATSGFGAIFLINRIPLWMHIGLQLAIPTSNDKYQLWTGFMLGIAIPN